MCMFIYIGMRVCRHLGLIIYIPVCVTVISKVHDLTIAAHSYYIWSNIHNNHSQLAVHKSVMLAVSAAGLIISDRISWLKR